MFVKRKSVWQLHLSKVTYIQAMHIVIINNDNYQYIILGSAQFLLNFLEIHNFIQQGCIKLIKHVRNYVKTI